MLKFKGLSIFLVFTMFISMLAFFNPLINAKADSVYGSRPMVGVINYNGTNGIYKVPDELSLTPPKWSYRLPFYASVTNDANRLTRTSNTQQEFVYYASTGLYKCILYTAFDDTYPINPSTDILFYKSTDGVNYTQYTCGTWDARKINYATTWQKVTYEITLNSDWDKYLKIVVCKTDGIITDPQLMRAEIFYKNAAGDDNVKLVDDFNDFSHMYSHSSGWQVDTSNPSIFRLVTTDGNTQAIMDQQISYANSAHIDYMAFVDGPKYYWPSNETLFRSSSNKGNLKYCVIVNTNEGESWTDRINRLVSYFGDSSYVKVLDSRPLFYLFDPSIWTKSDMDALRNASIAAGYGNPYVVGMTFNNENYSTFCDAGSCYLTTNAGVTEQYAGTSHTIPLVCFGANEQPRVDNPVPWGNGSSNSTEITGDALIPYVNQGIQWAKNNVAADESNCVLMNSWNEHCESAACVEPTLNSDGTANTANLTSVGNAIKSWETTSNNLLNNPGFENGITSWSAQTCNIATNSSAHSGSYACLATNRGGTWGSPAQDIKNLLIAYGQGKYRSSAFVKYASGSDSSTSIMVNTNDSNGSHWFSCGTTAVGASYTQLSGTMNITWTGTLNSALIYIQSNTSTVDFYVDDFSLSTDNLLNNPGFESGTASWSTQCCNIAANTSAYSGTYACLASNRSATYGSPIQDIKSILIANGQGSYNGSAWVKYASGTDASTSIMVNTNDSSGSHWFSCGTTAVATTYTQLSGTMNITWTGTLNSALLYIQSNTSTANLYIDDFRLTKP